jgi:mxaA protein
MRLAMPVRLLLVLAAAAFIAGRASAQVRVVEVQGPRPFGYFIGAVIPLDVEIAVDEPFLLLPSSVPRPRPIKFWLDLRSVAVTDLGVRNGERRYRLALEYQTFFAPLEPRTLEIPGFTLAAANGTSHGEAEVPPWTFLMSPLREVRPSQSDAASLLRPDAAPTLIPLAMARGFAIGSGAAALLFLGLLAWHRAWWPFAGRRARPFAQATRAVKRAFAGGTGTSAYLAGLQTLHRAFDASAGFRLLAGDVPALIERLPALRPLEPEIDQFFEASQRAFFGADPAAARTILPPMTLVSFGARLAAAERAEP